jgi:hypothetical protein
MMESFLSSLLEHTVLNHVTDDSDSHLIAQIDLNKEFDRNWLFMLRRFTNGVSPLRVESGRDTPFSHSEYTCHVESLLSLHRLIV